MEKDRTGTSHEGWHTNLPFPQSKYLLACYLPSSVRQYVVLHIRGRQSGIDWNDAGINIYRGTSGMKRSAVAMAIEGGRAMRYEIHSGLPRLHTVFDTGKDGNPMQEPVEGVRRITLLRQPLFPPPLSGPEPTFPHMH